jgi:hypothetical protein
LGWRDGRTRFHDRNLHRLVDVDAAQRQTRHGPICAPVAGAAAATAGLTPDAAAAGLTRGAATATAGLTPGAELTAILTSRAELTAILTSRAELTATLTSRAELTATLTSRAELTIAGAASSSNTAGSARAPVTAVAGRWICAVSAADWTHEKNGCQPQDQHLRDV